MAGCIDLGSIRKTGFIDLGGIQKNGSRQCEVFLGKYLFLQFKNIKRDTYDLAKQLEKYC